MTLSPEQISALEQIRAFLHNPKSQIFILRGYAGTGKTTLIKEILPMIQQVEKHPVLIAPTGRAAKILKEKTGLEARTIHSTIYKQTQTIIELAEEQKDTDKKEDQIKHIFSLRLEDMEASPQKVFVIDEASMLSASPSKEGLLQFGSGVLVEDLLTFARVKEGGKLIFIGDPAQLPPIEDSYSAALADEYFAEQEIVVESAELTEIHRQGKDSSILTNATKIRSLLTNSQRNELVFERKEGEVIDTTPSEAIQLFVQECPQPEIGKSIVIAYSNQMVKHYNDAIRKEYFPNQSHVCVGDVLQIVRNTSIPKESGEYQKLMNGDFIQVTKVNPQTKRISAPTWVRKEGKNEQQQIEFSFREISFRTEDGQELTAKIIESLLDSPERSLSHTEEVALFVYQEIRERELRKQGIVYPDPRILEINSLNNVLHVKYGYTITAHKAQGGEWRTAFVDYTGCTGLSPHALRWCYTATTRASHTLYGICIPHITPFDRLQFQGITPTSKANREAFSLGFIETKLLPSSATNAQRWKCVTATESLGKHNLKLVHIEPLQYKDRYTIQTPDGEVKVDCQYDGSGCYSKYTPLSIHPQSKEIIELLSDESGIEYSIDYLPSSSSLHQLYSRMCSACNTLGIKITNIVEHLQNYHIVYYLKTSGRFSLIKFYVDKNGNITHAMPQSDLGMEDQLLSTLINELQ